jgi:hypothetical protein
VEVSPARAYMKLTQSGLIVRSLDSVDARHGPGQGEIWNRRGLWPAEVGMVIGERVLVTSIEVVRANWHCMCRGSVLYLYHSN